MQKINQKKRRQFAFKDRLRSISYAFKGLKILWKEEHNFRIHLFTGTGVIIAGIIFKISLVDWLLLILTIGAVLSAEILNSAIENLADFVSPEKNEKIKKIKDLSAAGVLVTAITAIIIGSLIFLPKIFILF